LLATLIVLTSPTSTAFGELSSLHVLGIMCLATICGIVARYTFYLEGGTFSWLDMLRLCRKFSCGDDVRGVNRVGGVIRQPRRRTVRPL
jgi:hypothetical protein